MKRHQAASHLRGGSSKHQSDLHNQAQRGQSSPCTRRTALCSHFSKESATIIDRHRVHRCSVIECASRRSLAVKHRAALVLQKEVQASVAMRLQPRTQSDERAGISWRPHTHTRRRRAQGGRTRWSIARRCAASLACACVGHRASKFFFFCSSRDSFCSSFSSRRAFRWYLVYLPAPTGTSVYMSRTSAWTPPTRAVAFELPPSLWSRVTAVSRGRHAPAARSASDRWV
jgi:hypothetical protein